MPGTVDGEVGRGHRWKRHRLLGGENGKRIDFVECPK